MKLTLATLAHNNFMGKDFVARWALDEDRVLAASRGVGAERTLAARALLRALLFRQAGDQDWRLQADDRGKPSLIARDGTAGPSVSLSHSGAMVAAALGPVGASLGVDLEAHKQRDVQALAAHAFGPAERQRVAAGGAAVFFRLWTLREAMGKATGQGLSLAADGQDHLGEDGPHEGWWRQPGWFLGHVTPCPGYSLAAALMSPEDGMVEVEIISEDDLPHLPRHQPIT